MNVLFNIRGINAAPIEPFNSIRCRNYSALLLWAAVFLPLLALRSQTTELNISSKCFSADTLAIVRERECFMELWSMYSIQSLLSGIAYRSNGEQWRAHGCERACSELHKQLPAHRPWMNGMRQKNDPWMLITTKCRNNRRWRYGNYHIDCMESLWKMTEKSQIKLLSTIEARRSIWHGRRTIWRKKVCQHYHYHVYWKFRKCFCVQFCSITCVQASLAAARGRYGHFFHFSGKCLLLCSYGFLCAYIREIFFY